MVDIFRPDNALDTAKLFLNWDAMGKLMLERYIYKIFRFPKKLFDLIRVISIRMILIVSVLLFTHLDITITL